MYKFVSKLARCLVALVLLTCLALTPRLAYAQTFSSPASIPGGFTSYNNPSSIVYNSKLYVFLIGASDQRVYYKSYNGTSWDSSFTIIPNNSPHTTNPVGLTIYNGLLYVVVTNTSNNVQTASFNGTTWSSWSLIAGGTNLTNQGTSPIVYNNTFYLLFTNNSGNNTPELFCYSSFPTSYSIYTGSPGHPFEVSGVCGTQPSTMVFNGTLFLYGAPASPSYGTYSANLTGTSPTSLTFSPWGNGEDSPDFDTNQPIAVVNYNNSLVTFGCNYNDDSISINSSASGTSWNFPSELSPTLYSAHGVNASVYDGQIYAFYVRQSDNSVYYIYS